MNWKYFLLGAGIVLAAIPDGMTADFPQGGIANVNGAPAPTIDGVPLFPMILFEEWINPKDAVTFRDAGVKLYSFISRTGFLDLGWIDDEATDYTQMDQALAETAAVCPGDYMIPRIHLWAPEWWLRKNPDECFQAPDFERSGTFRQCESFASRVWREQAGAALRRQIRHMRESVYAPHILGITLATAAGGEWHQYGYDDSVAMTAYFRDWLRRTYHDDETQLRKSWGDPAVTFATATVPTLAELEAPGDVGIFIDPARSRHRPDYQEAYHDAAVTAIDHFARIVKEESDGRLLTIVMYGYVPDMHWNHKHVHHRALAKAFELSSVDAFASPHSYYRRRPGEDGGLRNYPASLAARGKLFIDEADDRTYLSKPKTFFTMAADLFETQQILWRSFGNVVTAGAGMWYMDHTSGAWYDDPELRRDFKRINRWADVSMTLPRAQVAEVAVISQPESEFYLGGAKDWSANMYESRQGQNEALYRAGAPFSRFLIDDLVKGLVPEHKVYIFMDCFYLTEAQKRAIETLKCNGHTLIWFYAPGFVSATALTPADMTALTGWDFTREPSGTPEVRLAQALDNGETTYGLVADMDSDMKKELTPRFLPHPNARTRVLGNFADTGAPALVEANYDAWSSVYSPYTPLPAEVLRDIYRRHGVFVYTDGNDNLVANRSWISLVAVTAGEKTIRLPEPMDVYDVIRERPVGRNITTFTVPLKAKETAIFAMGKNLSLPDASSEDAKKTDQKQEFQ